MITSMPSSRVVNEMRASITENGGCLLDNIPKFNSSKRVPAKQANRCPPDDEQQQRKKERNREVLVRASDWCEVMFGPMDPKILEKNKIIENDDQYATQPTKLRFEGRVVYVTREYVFSRRVFELDASCWRELGDDVR